MLNFFLSMIYVSILHVCTTCQEIIRGNKKEYEILLIKIKIMIFWSQLLKKIQQSKSCFSIFKRNYLHCCHFHLLYYRIFPISNVYYIILYSEGPSHFLIVFASSHIWKRDPSISHSLTHNCGHYLMQHLGRKLNLGTWAILSRSRPLNSALCLSFPNSYRIHIYDTPQHPETPPQI